jgi:hypothetical protein
MHGAAAAAEGGLAKTVVNVEAFEGADLAATEVAGHSGLAGHVASGRVQVIEGAWIANGGEWEGCNRRVLEALARHRQEVEERVLERFLMASACAEVMAALT